MKKNKKIRNKLLIERFQKLAGIKPLYYYLNDGKFIFSSTIPAILEHDITRTPNERLIRDFLLYNNVDFADETFFNEINRFPKGTFGFFDLAKNFIFFISSKFDLSFPTITNPIIPIFLWGVHQYA